MIKTNFIPYTIYRIPNLLVTASGHHRPTCCGFRWMIETCYNYCYPDYGSGESCLTVVDFFDSKHYLMIFVVLAFASSKAYYQVFDLVVAMAVYSTFVPSFRYCFSDEHYRFCRHTYCLVSPMLVPYCSYFFQFVLY